MSLKGMYAWAEKVAEGKFHGTIEEQGGKLVFKGTVATEAEKNEIWNAIKTIPTWQQDINADIRVTGGPSAAASAPPPAAQPAATPPPGAPPAPPTAAGAPSRKDLHGQVRRYAQPDRERTPRQCGRLHEDL